MEGGADLAKERIGLMGGSFNPIHYRHLTIAACALAEAKLNRVIFLPTGNPPHKHAELADAEHRFEMTRLATLRDPAFSTSRVEIDREGVIYTADTLQILRHTMPDADFFYIIGEDTLMELPNWRTPDKVFALCSFLVCRRQEDHTATIPMVKTLEARGARFQFLSLPPLDISSTDIRQQLAQGIFPPELPMQVAEYIRLMGLYGVPSTVPQAEETYRKLRLALSDKRLLHSLLVAATARGLAMDHRMNPTQCETAGLLHDCAKCMPLQAQQRIAREHRLLLDDETLSSDNLLHGPVGAVVAETEYNVGDINILSAIRCHTTGRVGMLPTDMVLFLADKIEPSRRTYPALEDVRVMARKNLIAATLTSMRSTMAYVSRQKATLHPTTQRVVQWLERLPSSV